MAFGMGPVKKRGSKKVNWSKYNRKLTKKTKEEIKNRKWLPERSGSSEGRSSSAMMTGGGSRIGEPVKNKALEQKKAAAREILEQYKKKKKENARKIATERFNSTLGSRVGQKTERKKVEYKPRTYQQEDKGLTKREQGYKYNYRYSGQNNANQVGSGFQTALKAGTFSSRAKEKEKENVAKSIQRDYLNDKKSTKKAFIAGLTKSDSNVKTRTQKLFGRDVDLSKVTKRKAYKAGDTVQEVASYFIAPQEAVAGKIGSKVIKAGAKKILKDAAKKQGIKLGKKELSRALVEKAGSKIVKDASGTVLGKVAKTAATKEGTKALKEASAKVAQSKLKKQLIRRGADVAANAPLNAIYSIQNSTNKDGKVNWKKASKEMLLNTGLDVGMGGGIDALVGGAKARKALKKKSEKVVQKNLNKSLKQAAEKATENAKKEADVFRPTVSATRKARDKNVVVGNAVKAESDRIDNALATNKISAKEAKAQRKALRKEVKERYGKNTFATNTEGKVEQIKVGKSGATVKENTRAVARLDAKKSNVGIRRLERPQVAEGSTADKFMQKVDKKATQKRRLATERDRELLKAQEGYTRQEAKLAKEREAFERSGQARQPIRKKGEQLDLRNEAKVADDARYGKTEEAKVADEVRRLKSDAKTKAAANRRDVAIRKVLSPYMDTSVERSKPVVDAVEKYVKDGDENALWREIRRQIPDFDAEYQRAKLTKKQQRLGANPSFSRTFREVGASDEMLDRMTDDLVRDLKTAATKAEPKGAKGYQMPERPTSRAAETDNIVDETPRAEDLYPDAQKTDTSSERKFKDSIGEHIENRVERKREERLKADKERNAKMDEAVEKMNEGETTIEGATKARRDANQAAAEDLFEQAKKPLDRDTAGANDNLLPEVKASREKANAAKEAENKAYDSYFEAGKTHKRLAAEDTQKRAGDIDANSGAISVGKTTKIKNPYSGKKPLQESTETVKVDISPQDVGATKNVINSAEGKRNTIRDYALNLFGNGRNVTVKNVTFNSKPYDVYIGRRSVKKVISDPNLSAEKVTVFKNIDEIINNATYLGSGKYGKNKAKAKDVIRYDYFETDVKIGQKDYVVSFDVEVYPSTNNYRTHKINEMNLIAKSDAHVGPVPTAADNASSSFNSNLSQNGKNVNSPEPPQSADEVTAMYKNNVGTSNGDKKESAVAIIKSLRRKFVNSLGNIEDEAAKFAKRTNNENFAKEMRGEVNNVRVARKRAQYILAEEQTDMNGRVVGEAWQTIQKDLEKKGTYDEACAYLNLKHHIDRVRNADMEDAATTNVFGYKLEVNDKRVFEFNGEAMSIDEAERRAQLLLDKNPDLLEDASRITQFFRNNLASQVQSGRISADTAAHLMDTYPHYVPTYRAGYKNSYGMSAAGLDASVKGLKNAKGSGRELLSMADQAAINTNDTFVTGAYNELSKKIADMSTLPIEKSDMSLDTVMEQALMFDAKNGKLRYFDDGELVQVDVKDDIIKDLLDMKGQKTQSEFNTFLRGATKVNTIFKSLITNYSPIFMVRNFMRDLPEGAFQSIGTRGYLKHIPDAALSIAKNDEWHKAYARMGGKGANLITKADGSLNSGFMSKLKGNTLGRIEAMNDFAESIPRVAEFKNALERMGVSSPDLATASQLKQAVEAAADVTVNFGRSGSLGRMFNSTFIPFFNPALQGFSKIGRTLARDKSVAGFMKMGAKLGLLGVAPAAANELLIGDNKWYDQIPDREKMTNYFVPLDADNPLAKLFGSTKVGAKDGEIFLKIPKARFLSVVGAIPQKAMGSLDDSSFGDLVKVGADQIGPVGFSNNILMPALAAGFTNKTWYGADIDPTWMLSQEQQGKMTKNQFRDANTSKIAIALSDFARDHLGKDVSPKRIDYLLDSYGGIVGDIGLGNTRAAAQRGLIAKGFSTDSTTQSDLPTRYYDTLQKLGKKSINGSKEAKADLEKMEGWKDRISTLSKTIRGLQESNVKGKEKKVRELTKVRNALMKKALDGETSQSDAGDIKAIAKTLGNKKAFDLIATKGDKAILKKYGKADDNFLKGYIAARELRGGGNKKTATALAIVRSGAGEKVAEAFGLTKKGDKELASAYQRAKDYIKNGGTVKEYRALQKVVKDSKLRGNDYIGIATELAKAGAKDRAFKLYDIKNDKVQRARNMAALNISSKDIKKHRSKADTDGSGRNNKSEVLSYVSRLKASREVKSIIYDSLAKWRNNGNPYGSVHKTAKQAADPKIKAKVDKALAWNNSIITPHRSGFELDPKTGKPKKNGKTVGSIGTRLNFPGGMTHDELKKAIKEGKIKGRTVTERLHNAFGSRIGDAKKKTIYPATNIKNIKRHKDGTVDITFANKEVWRNPPKHDYTKDNTKLESGGSGGGRGWRRRGYGRGGGGGARGTRTITDFAPNKKNVSYTPKKYGTGGIGAGGRLKRHTSPVKETSVTLGTPKITIKPKKSKKFTIKTENFKPSDMGLSKAELRALLKAAVAPTTSTPQTQKKANKDVYSVRTSKMK